MAEEWFDELAEFLRIPSISADTAHAADVVRAGEWVCSLIRAAGGACEVVDWHGQPLAIGELRASTGAERRRPSSATGTSMSSRRTRSSCGRATRSSPRSAATTCTAAAPSTTRASSTCCSPRRASCARAGELPVNVRFCCDGEEETGRPFDRRVPRGRRTRGRRSDHLRQRHDSPRCPCLQRRDPRHGVLPRHGPHRRTRPALGDVRRSGAQRRPRADQDARRPDRA